MLLAVLFVQEQLLAFDINVQLTVLLLAVYATVLPPPLLYPLVGGYVLLDNLFMGSFNWLYTPAMFFAWFLFVILFRLIRRRALWQKVVFATLFGFVYGWIFAIPHAITFGFDRLWPYLVTDLGAEVTMAAVDFVTVLFLYEPLRRLLESLRQGGREA